MREGESPACFSRSCEVDDERRVLHIISQAQSLFLSDIDPHVLFDGLLESLLEISDSQYGVICELTHDADGQWCLVSRAVTDVSWNDWSRSLYQSYRTGGLEFRNPKSLFGSIVATGEPVLSENPPHDPRAGGVPEGHPPLRSFLGLPLYSGDRLAGVAGLANFPLERARELIDLLDPLLRTCGLLINAYRNEQRRREAERGMQRAHDELEQRVWERTEELARTNELLRAEIEQGNELERRLRRQQAALLKLATHGISPEGLEAALCTITETAAHTLSVERAGVWFYNGERSLLRCDDLFDPGTGAHTRGMTLGAGDYPSYFRALERQRVISAGDAGRDPRTRELAAAYIDGVGVRSLLAAPVRRYGETVGVLCHTHLGEPRRWTLDEQSFAASVADVVALMLESHEHRRMERLLRESEARFRQLAENIKEVFWLTDPSKTETFYISPAYEDIWGQSCSSMYQRPESFIERIHPGDRARVLSAIGRQADGDYDETYRITRPDGSERWIRDRAFPVRNEHGVVYRIAGIAEDVTERQESESWMRMLSSVVEQTADSVLITTPDGVIEYVNNAFEATTGYRREEVLGRKPNIVKSGRHTQEFYAELWQTIRRGEPYRSVFINRRKDGSLYYEEKTITPLKDSGGQVINFVSTGHDITQRMRAEERLHFLAYHDLITELPNRAMFLERLSHALVRREERGQLLAVLFLDLDQFKKINDSLGHPLGDRLLQALPQRISPCLGRGDTLARFGGDEFAVLIEDAPHARAVSQMAAKIIDAFADPFLVDGHELYISTSIGISLFPDDCDDAATLLKHADTAMYGAKELGRNCFQFYSKEMSVKVSERLSLETHLRRALERGEYELLYQPQIALGSGMIVGAEALLRWRRPDGELASPDRFVPVLEETGLIVSVGQWVLETACRQAREWQASGGLPVRISVNLSGRQFFEPRLDAYVAKVLRDHGLEPQQLELEITESVLMQHDHATKENLAALDALGVRLSIDDFGTGYSSLSYLKRFPVDTIKIDRSFIRDITTDRDSAAIVLAIIAMAKKLQLEVVAEGVETEQQLLFLSEHGCDLLQGYLCSPPVHPPAVERLLKQRSPCCSARPPGADT